MNVAFNDPVTNSTRALSEMKRLKDEGVDLVVFPEAFLTGYCVSSLTDAQKIAIPDDHEAILRLFAGAKQFGLHIAFGYAALREGKLFNSAILACPDGTVHRYDKTHLPELGYDKFVEDGADLPVFETALGRIGILICFDLRPPEAARCLALKGADLILLPTNWPNGAQISAEHFTVVRAAENRVFLAACNRVGHENGFDFIGLSRIVSPGGMVRAQAGSGEETLVADLDLEEARLKRITVIPGQYEMTVFDSRRPELYSSLG